MQKTIVSNKQIISFDELYLINYCHPNCTPLKNIMRLPKDEAFILAKKMAKDNPETTAFYRFADFENYYSRRLKVDEILYRNFLLLDGKPQNEHPFSFVLQGSKYLDKWFDNGLITKIRLYDIPSELISFTYGDSSATFSKNNQINMLTKQMLIDDIHAFGDTLDNYLKEIRNKHYYIEAQLWVDDNFFELDSLL